jgi:hypothetical protein
MKKVFAVIIICVCFAALGTAGYCQDYGNSDSSIEQAESQMDQKLDSEISSDQAQGQSEMDRANEEMDAGMKIE